MSPQACTSSAPRGGAFCIGLPEPAREGAVSKLEATGKKRAKTGGRQAGTPNKVNAEFRDTVRQLLEDNSGNVGRWLTLVAEGDGTDKGAPDPGRALDLLAKLAE